MIRNVKAITASTFVAMFFFGISTSLVGAAAKEIGLTPTQIGLLLTCQNIGFMVSVMLAGALADTVNKARLMFVGSIILAVAYFTFFLTDFFWLNLVIMFLIGAGAGVYEGVTDALLLDLHTDRPGFYINVNHFFVTVGAIMIAVYLTFSMLEWRSAVVLSAGLVLILAFVFSLVRLQGKDRRVEPYLDRLRIITRDRVVLALFIAALIAVGVELSTIGILTTFLSDMRAFSAYSAGVGLILFSVGMAIGRVLVGWFSSNEQLVRMILTLFALSAILFAALFFIDFGVWTYATIILAGLAISALVPLIMTLGGLLYPEMSGTVLGSIKVAFPIGGIVLPFLMSVITDLVSFQAALWLNSIAFLLGFLVLFSTFRRDPALVSEPA